MEADVRGTTVEAETRTVLQASRRSDPSTCMDGPVHPAERACQLAVTDGFLAVALHRIRSGWWVATVGGLDHFFVRGRSLRETRARLRRELEALLGPGLGPSVRLQEEVRLPGGLGATVREVRVACQRSEEARREAREALAGAASRLVGEAQLSLRDAGEVLGISGQWVGILTRTGEGSY